MTSWLSLLCLSVATALRAPTRTLRPRPLLQATQLEQLAEQTVLSIDTGDLDVIEQYAKGGLISDATTNPLFVAQAGTSGDARYVAFVDKAIAYAKANSGGDDVVSLAMDRLAVELGLEIVKLVPGYVSTEVDIRASFDTEESVRRARRIIAMYEAEGVDRSRVLVKLLAPGRAQRRILGRDGITCNITLIFGFAQGIAAAQAGARHLALPRPCQGRFSATAARRVRAGEDPGVVVVTHLGTTRSTATAPSACRRRGGRRGASDPSYAVDEILTAGTDRMTIPPPLLELPAASQAMSSRPARRPRPAPTPSSSTTSRAFGSP